MKKFVVNLSTEERDRIHALIQKGRAPAWQVLKARVLLKVDASAAGDAWSDSQIAAVLETNIDTIARTRQQFVEGGIEAALTRKPPPTRPASASSTRPSKPN